MQKIQPEINKITGKMIIVVMIYSITVRNDTVSTEVELFLTGTQSLTFGSTRV